MNLNLIYINLIEIEIEQKSTKSTLSAQVK